MRVGDDWQRAACRLNGRHQRHLSLVSRNTSMWLVNRSQLTTASARGHNRLITGKNQNTTKNPNGSRRLHRGRPYSIVNRLVTWMQVLTGADCLSRSPTRRLAMSKIRRTSCGVARHNIPRKGNHQLLGNSILLIEIR